MVTSEVNKNVLDWVQNNAHVYEDKDSRVEYIFSIGEQYKSDFQVRVRRLKSDSPELNLSDCKELEVAIFQYPNWEPPSLEDSVIEVANIKITLECALIPSSIHPPDNDKFKSQSWSKEFKKSTTSNSFFERSSAKVSPDTVCDIIRHCHSVYGLKAFW
jgi:hypothetical protein